MKNKKPHALILTGDGITSEGETAQAFQMANFQTTIVHLNDLIARNMSLDDLSQKYSVFVLPSGASFSDGLQPGKVLALKIQYQLRWDLLTYAQRGGLVLGIGNGFQTLIRMGIFGKDISITSNIHNKFINTWVKVTPSGNRCIWLKGLGTLDLAIRNGYGRLVIAVNRRDETLEKIERLEIPCLRYEVNPLGSEENLAGLCTANGRIFGLIPHPETFIRWSSYPDWTSQSVRASSPGQGLLIFERAYQEVMNSQ